MNKIHEEMQERLIKEKIIRTEDDKLFHASLEKLSFLDKIIMFNPIFLKCIQKLIKSNFNNDLESLKNIEDSKERILLADTILYIHRGSNMMIKD